MRYFFQGLAVALTSIAPIGIQNLFVINSAISFPPARALAVATAVFLFDMSLTLSAFFGTGSLISAFPALRGAVLLAGGLMVLKIGAGLLFAKGSAFAGGARVLSLKQIVSTAFVVTWFNPQALVDTTLFFGAFRASLPASAVPPFVTGCLTASPLWFLSLTLLVSAIRKRFSPVVLRALNAFCGAIIIVCGARLLWNFLSATGR